MTRLFAFFAALLISGIAVTSACTAAQGQEGGAIRFELEPAHSNKGAVHAEFRRGGRTSNQWSTDFPAAELAGLDFARLRGADTNPLRFAIVREAGRLDCAGNGGRGRADGTCSFTPDAGFVDYLVSRGVERPRGDDAFALMAVNVRRDMLDALSAARYPTPELDDLIALTALGVSGDYIARLARAGYRPSDLDALVQFKALGITPEWIQAFARLGYANPPADELVQLKALDIDAEFVAGFERIGYGRLPADALVQFKAMGITPEFVAGFRRVGYQRLDTDDLVQLKALGITPEFAARMRTGAALPSPDRLVELRVGADILRRK